MLKSVGCISCILSIISCILSILLAGFAALSCSPTVAQQSGDYLREFHRRAVELETADWIHWGTRPGKFSNWTNHSNRLVPVYTWGLRLGPYRGENSVYRDEDMLADLYGQPTRFSVNPEANYFDQTDIYWLQRRAWKSGKKHVILVVFDGLDWQITQAASAYKNKKVLYKRGRGSGLHFLDYGNGEAFSKYGFCVTSPHNGDTDIDVNGQVITSQNTEKGGGYSADFAGQMPWSKPADPEYLIGQRREHPHPYTDSAASATSLNTGKKTFNGSINISHDGQQLKTLAHEMQEAGYAIGVVTNVPISHATPGCVYAHNVERSDYQDITRDLLGIKSIAHREKALPGVDVLIGCGWGETRAEDEDQGFNFIPGNKFLADGDLKRIDHTSGGKYVVAQRTPGKLGKDVLMQGAREAAEANMRFFGFFGAMDGHLPYQTADGNYNPARGVSDMDVYQPEDVTENPTLADMTKAALTVLEKSESGFFLCVEAGDVDWAEHNNNVDDAIGSVFSGDDAFKVITDWVEANSNWEETCVVLTADHGHMLFVDDFRVLTGERELESEAAFKEKLEAKRAEDAEKD